MFNPFFNLAHDFEFMCQASGWELNFGSDILLAVSDIEQHDSGISTAAQLLFHSYRAMANFDGETIQVLVSFKRTRKSVCL